MEEEDENGGEVGDKKATTEGAKEPYSAPRLTQYGNLTTITKDQHVDDQYKIKAVITVLVQ